MFLRFKKQLFLDHFLSTHDVDAALEHGMAAALQVIDGGVGKVVLRIYFGDAGRCGEMCAEEVHVGVVPRGWRLVLAVGVGHMLTFADG